jgi:hypothetical protein
MSSGDANGPTFVPTAEDYRATVERIRLRRRGKARTAGVAVAGGVLAAVMVVVIGAGGGGTASVLRQEQPGAAGTGVSAAPQDVTAPDVASSPGPPVAVIPSHSSPTTAPTALPPPVGSPAARPTPRPAEPGITRSYDGSAGVTVGGSLCNGQVGGSQTHTEDSFCASTSASEADADSRRRVPIQSSVCENKAELNSTVLSFNTSREVDYAIYQGSRLVWRWSAGRPAATAPGHTLAIDPGQCWTWQTTWRAVDARGVALHGDFVLKATSSAKELKAVYNPSSYSFTL